MNNSNKSGPKPADETPQTQEFSEDDLFKLTMEKKWQEVAEIYQKHPNAHTTKLTKSEETPLHIAVSSYHPGRPSHASFIEQMIAFIDENISPVSLTDVLSMQNVNGDTPLHLAAAVGWVEICECIASKHRDLISIRNVKGETPLFIAAHHGKLQAFLCLHELYNDKKDRQAADVEPDESLCRRRDGNTILHAAINGQYFKLAYQIISYYPKLVNYVNVEGESPLHVLARKPNVFKSSSHLGFYDSIIYQCVFVDELRQQKYDPGASQNGYYPASTDQINLPENYRTCVAFFLLIWTPISKSISAGFPFCIKENECRDDDDDEENQESQIKDGKGKRKDDALFPPNYATCILLFRFAIKVILTVLGVGYWRIREIQEKKELHSHAIEIMDKMIEHYAVSRYKYDSNGQRPVLKPQHDFLEGIEIPDTPPPADDHDALQSSETGSGTTSSTRAQHKNGHQMDPKIPGILGYLAKKWDLSDAVEKGPNVLVKKDTPLLVAAKMGIPEMVKKIISTCPVAIQDHDSNGKNVLLLAAENRQTSVFDYLLKTNLPEYMFHQLDDEGNSILHLAAKLGEFQPWRIPGAALQMQWEIKWYKHVKSSVPELFFAHHNTKRETPREIFTTTHQKLVKEGNEWLIKTSESCSVVAALIATVAFATSATVPGGLDQKTGHPVLEDHTAFDVFSITSLVALCLSVTALVFFLAIITSRCEENDFQVNLPRKLLMGLTCLFASIAGMLVSFCAGHTFILREKLRITAVPIYAVAGIPVTLFAIAQLPLYFDLLWAACRRVPQRSYKLFFE
ncbi:hypothetical protein Salat_1720900 [Sesamum alatum]|uniref:PGG domain-containing protein n=1 Tax=Sesamum alatum TaxID=300844 RepID=A0AAE2CK94_9LAMI|nr:hypothetical protein Salat_1720900 [Sesamum alatum]